MSYDDHEGSGGGDGWRGGGCRDGRDSGGWTPAWGWWSGDDLKSRARRRLWPRGALCDHGDRTAPGQDQQSSDGIASPTASGQDQNSSGQSHVDLGSLLLSDLRRAEYAIQFELRGRGVALATLETFPTLVGIHRCVIIDAAAIAEAHSRTDACRTWFETARSAMASLESSEQALKEMKQKEEHRLAKKRNWAKQDYHRKKARQLEIVDGAEFVDIDGPFAQDGL